MEIRPLTADDLEPAGALLYGAFAHAASSHGVPAPWPDEAAARALLERYHRARSATVLVAEEGGALIALGAQRLRGEVTTMGPIASYIPGRGIGGALVDELLRRADDEGAAAQRLYVDGWNAPAFALYAGRGFGVVDAVLHVEREAGAGPALGNARGLEMRAFGSRDLDELRRFDHKLTGLERPDDLGAMVRLVARRRGEVVGYLGASETHLDQAYALGPAVAVDVMDLFTLLTYALSAATEDDANWRASERGLRARLSTSAPAASMAALGLGFRIRELGYILSRGAPPPARPPQLYSLDPEIV
ncbi:GNAT family N-acetyltransferase [Haliangium ochraceum]|uniref:GCN5-related N-acetyltransferase n=1 Tax=Haliangium ochraceum (strain DSM 14365 / JCM 11303 / SMP-2) TaxID=502025 RepID=D0LJK9_HALO1|nr:GNAT family N-acetyltransferase [Haliangium ochraceum]ACY16583.1 GCN5-related N-acetyltransferase [Haliangium ochraceum DSM 14365]